MKQYVIGMDGGGTKTAVAAADAGGHILFRLSGGAINCNSETPSNVMKNLTAILDGVSEGAGSLEACSGICIAAAGVSNPAARCYHSKRRSRQI